MRVLRASKSRISSAENPLGPCCVGNSPEFIEYIEHSRMSRNARKSNVFPAHLFSLLLV